MTERQMQFAASISTCLGELFNDESDYSMDIDPSDEEQIKDFLWALSTVVPCSMLGKITGGDMNYLEFNHLANKLCFENMTINTQE